MKIFKALASGFIRTLKVWKGLLLPWLGSLLTVSLVAIPLRGFFKSAFNGSMITERLKDGIDMEVLGDIGTGFRSLMSSFPLALLVLILAGILLGAFLNGGIFDSLKSSSGKFSASDFFKASVKNFWPFLVISLIITVIILVTVFLIVVIPFNLVVLSEAGSESEKALILTAFFSVLGFLLISMIFTLTADYARAWHVAQDGNACFRAIGFGFSRTFRTFFSSYPMMLIVFIMQILFTFLVITIIGQWKPVSGGGVFLLFLASQVLFYLKCILKVWRYGSVTSLMEIRNSEIQ